MYQLSWIAGVVLEVVLVLTIGLPPVARIIGLATNLSSFVFGSAEFVFDFDEILGRLAEQLYIT
ncbi:hypothetical protein BASH2_02151 [Bacillus anthracis]|nr:hypothetical protein BASH2_02151 [Bacillus anthracis]